MYEKQLELIGLSPNEAKVYLALLEYGESSIGDISRESGIHRRSIYDTLNRLTDKGLVFPIFQGRENAYQAVDPNKLMELLYEKQRSFQQVLPKLKKLEQKEISKEAAFIYRGIEGYKNYIRDMTRVAEDTYFLGAKGNWVTPGASLEMEKVFQRRIKEKGKTLKILFDPRVKKRKDILKTTTGEYKFLPEGYETLGIVDVFGDYVVTFVSEGIGNFGEDGSIFVMRNDELAESYRTWFRLIWDLVPGKEL